MFKNLARELETSEKKIKIKSIRTISEAEEKDHLKKIPQYTPDVVDFIRRCDTVIQAEEVIDYMEKRGEIDKDYAERLKKQLKNKGLRSFGSKKEKDYYLKHGKL